MNLSRISICIIMKNASKTLKECLSALEKFDEIILLDNESTDESLKIAQEFKAKFKGNLIIKSTEFLGFGAMKNLCINLAKNEWILNIDSDEILENSALDEISKLDLKQNCIYALPRKNLYSGTHIKASGWHPDFTFRLFNKNYTKFNENFVHESLILSAQTQKIYLKNGLKHYAYENLSGLLEKVQKYSELYAAQNIKKGSLVSALINSAWKFFRDYFFKKGVFYGYKGFFISFCNALGVFFKYAKAYERAKNLRASLIITTYNQKERLKLVLESVKELEPLPFEVLIADDGSKNDTKELIENFAKNFPCPLYHIWQEDCGFRLSKSRNNAINQATGEYIICIDGDMILNKNFIKDHLNFAKSGTILQGSRVLLNQKQTGGGLG